MYMITELDPPRPGGISQVTDLNDKGDAGGMASTPAGVWQPVTWQQGGPATVVAAPAGPDIAGASVAAINNQSDVVGEYGPASGGGFAAKYGYLSRGGVVTDFGQVLGTARSGAFDINDSGTVVGAFGPDLPVPGAYHAFRYHAASGAVDDLGMPAGSISAVATAISPNGLIAGFADYASGQLHGWIFNAGFSVLDAVARSGAEGPLLIADVNDGGVVVGAMPLAGQDYMAFSLATADASAQPVPLGVLPGCSASFALGINQHGAVVGYCSAGTADRAFLAFQGGGMQDLSSAVNPDAGWVLNRATAINEQGQIAGYGQIAGQQRGFLLTPYVVPNWPLYQVVATILFGVIQDGGGTVIVPGLPPIPEPPWGWGQLSPVLKDVIVGAALSQLATLLPDAPAQRQVEEAGLGMIKRALAVMEQRAR